MTLPNEHKPDAKSGKRPKGDYVVGKCKPPIHTLFRWGAVPDFQTKISSCWLR